MAGGEHGDVHIPQGEYVLAGDGVQHVPQSGTAEGQRGGGAVAGVEGQAVLLGQGGQPGGMVGVLMGKQHGSHVLRRQAQLPQRRGDASGGDAGVHQQVDAAAGQQQADALRAAGKCMYSQQRYMSSLYEKHPLQEAAASRSGRWMAVCVRRRGSPRRSRRALPPGRCPRLRPGACPPGPHSPARYTEYGSAPSCPGQPIRR